MTAADIEQNVQMLGMMGPMLFTGMTATAKQTIGLDDLLLYEYESEVAWDMSGLVQMAAASGQLPAELTADERSGRIRHQDDDQQQQHVH